MYSCMRFLLTSLDVKALNVCMPVRVSNINSEAQSRGIVCEQELGDHA